MKKIVSLCVLASLITGCSSKSSEEANTLLTGQITDSNGSPVNGVMVRIKNSETGLSETVYSDENGEYRLPTNLAGSLNIKTRTPYFRDVSSNITLEKGGDATRDFKLEKLTKAKDISDSLPGVFHFGEIKFDADPSSPFSKASFQRDCAGCHQFGNEFTRQPRPVEFWSPTVARMHGYIGNTDPNAIEKRANMIVEAFQGESLTIKPEFPVDAEIHNAKIYEYEWEGILFPHDADVSVDDGLIYAVDRHGYKMIVTDLSNGKSDYIDQPPSDRPPEEGGNGYTSRSGQPGPHSLALGKNGLWYTTNATDDTIGVFDAKTRKWKKSYILPEPARYPHTIRIDKNNMVWFTLAVSDQLGRVDPATGKMDLINLPKAKPIGLAGGTSPYGIDVSPIDGKVWYARLYGDKIGYVNPETLEVTEYDSPVRGPRRLRFDADGTIWLTGYTEGMIARIKPDDMDIKVYKMPEYMDGYRPAPYALAVNPDTQEIWINETMTDRVYRFLPDEERFIIYPMPLRGTYTRDFAFTKDGWACTANSPIINAALEDGIAGLICIDPDGSGRS